MDNLQEQRQAAINSLKLALETHEKPEEEEDAILPFIKGHGVQSLRFVFQWEEEALDIDFSLPYERVLSDEETLLDDKAMVSAAIRLAIALLMAAESGNLLREGEAHLSVWCDGNAAGWSTIGPDEATIEESEELLILVERLSSDVETTGMDEALSIIWP